MSKVGLLLVASVSSSMAVSVQVDLTLAAGTNFITDNTGTNLSAGVSTVNGDGALMELGYFTGDTSTFTGTWVALTGPSSNNTLVTTVGDLTAQDGTIPIPDGQFSIQVLFDTNVAGTANDLPAGGQQLALRFYNGTTRGTSTHFNTATSDAWSFVTPANPTPPPVNVNLDSVTNTIIWEDNTRAFATSLVVPEPSSTALLGLGGLALILRRRR